VKDAFTKALALKEKSNVAREIVCRILSTAVDENCVDSCLPGKLFILYYAASGSSNSSKT
jgi:hypothetical protein